MPGFLLVNPRAGGAKHTDELVAEARSRGVEVHLLEPDDDPAAGSVEAREAGQLGRPGEPLGGEAGVHGEDVGPGGGQEPAVHLGGAELTAPTQVVRGRGVRLEVEQRRAPAADGEPGMRVEHGRVPPSRAG